MTRVLAAALLLAGALTLASCAGPTMTPNAAQALAQGAADVRAAVESGDRDIAEGALAALRSSVDDLARRDAISDEKLVDILTAINDVEAALDVMPTTTTTVYEDEDDDDDDDHEGKGKGRGKSGKGHGTD